MGRENVFDLTEPDTHSFIANGIVISNCGEQSLYPHESCNLGSINLSKLVIKNNDDSYSFDWKKYESIIRITTRFLDNIIDVNNYPIPEIEKASIESRRIGLGVMGVADLLYMLKIPYNSDKGFTLQNKLSEALSYYSMLESINIAKERERFPLCDKTEYPEGKIPLSGYYEIEPSKYNYDWDGLVDSIKRNGIRNVLTTTIAPTGTISMIAECSSGMEPTFALSFEKHVTVGKFIYVNKILEKELEKLGLHNDKILQKITNNYGSLKGIKEIPESLRNIFITAMDLHWADHIMAQSVWQKWIGNSISKTINMPYDVTADDIKAAYLLAHEMGLKGITVYRDGSRHEQVLHMSDKESKKTFTVEPSNHVMEYIVHEINNEYVKSHVESAINGVNNGMNDNIINDITPQNLNNDGWEEEPNNPIKLDIGFSGITDENGLVSDPNVSILKIINPTTMEKCPECVVNYLTFTGGCKICLDCGWNACSG